MGRTEFLTWKRLRGEPWLAEQKQKQKLQRERNGARRSARISAPQKYLTPPTLLETPGYVNYPDPSPRLAFRCGLLMGWSAGLPVIVRHERERLRGRVVRNCLTDEGRPLGTGLQERVPNHLRRLWSKAMVVSAEGKGLARTRSGTRQEEDCKGTTVEVSKAIRRCQNRGWMTAAGQSSDETGFRAGRHPA